MHVVLAGGGIGGMAAATALARRGVEVTVVERSAAPGELGAGLQLSPNATRVLFGFGLERQLRAIGFAPEAAEVRDHRTARGLLRVPLGAAAEHRWGAPYLQVHRADLHALLLDAATAGGAQVRWGAAVLGFDQDYLGVSVRLGAEVVRADVLVGCDGIRSGVAAALFGEAPARFTGQSAWRALVPGDRLPAGLAPPLAMVWTGRGRHFVHYPIRSGRLVNLVGVVPRTGRTDESWTEAGDPAALQADFAGWPSPVAELVAAADRVWRFALHDRPPRPRWSVGRISLLGDAAHPATPFLAQGAAMAIEDAEALARRLSTEGDAPSALRAYERERRPRTARVQAWSRRNQHLFHLPTVAAEAAFGAARALDRIAGEAGTARLDWLYGYDAPNPHSR